MEQSRNGTTISYMTDEMADCQDTQDQRGYTKTNRRTQQTATPGFTEIFIVGLKMAKTTAASASADTPISPDNHGWRLQVFIAQRIPIPAGSWSTGGASSEVSMSLHTSGLQCVTHSYDAASS